MNDYHTKTEQWLDNLLEKDIFRHPYKGLNNLDVYKDIHRWNRGDSPLSEAKELFPDQNSSLVYILLDGLGTHLKPYWPNGGFFERTHKKTANAVFPSTTACALTSLATASPVNQNGIVGWNTYIPEWDKIINVLPYSDKLTSEFLDPQVHKISDAIFGEALWPESKKPVRLLSPAPYVEGTYNKHTNFGGELIPFDDVPQSLDLLFEAIVAKKGFSYLYLSQIDHSEHSNGVFSEETRKVVEEFDSLLSDFDDRLKKSDFKGTVILSADHGQVDIDEEKKRGYTVEDPLMELLEAPLSCESTLPVFHPKTGKEEELISYMDDLFQGEMKLVKPDLLIKKGIFGDSDFEPRTLKRFGTFIGLSESPVAIHLDKINEEPFRLKGYHGGLRKDEIEVPLFVCNYS